MEGQGLAYLCARGERAQELVWLSEFLPDPSPEVSVLDVGCCYSIVLSVLRHLGFNAEGVDLRPYEYGPSVVCDARAMPFPDRAFDFAFSISTIEHIGLPHRPYGVRHRDPDGDLKAMAEICRVARRGVLVTFPVGEGAESWFGHRGWIRFYREDRVRELLRIAAQGFRWVTLRCAVREGLRWREVPPEEAFQVRSVEDPDGAQALGCIEARNDRELDPTRCRAEGAASNDWSVIGSDTASNEHRDGHVYSEEGSGDREGGSRVDPSRQPSKLESDS